MHAGFSVIPFRINSKHHALVKLGFPNLGLSIGEPAIGY